MEFKTEEWEQIKDLFQAALEVEQSSRRQFLKQESGSAGVRDAVEQLLLAHQQAGSLLEDNPAIDAGLLCVPLGNGLAPGSVLADRFQILRFLARGGMGEVYEAQDLELQTSVAIKTIRPEIANLPQALTRFKREVHLARQVTHPNVCRIFDLFRHRDPANPAADIVFVSMELLSGETLSERIKRTGRLSAEQALDILRQIVPALGAAHAVGILHRDLKPGNILLEPAKLGGVRAVITDFGLAWSQNSRSEVSLSGSGMLAFGTPEYMSPEQVEGRELTPASDLYSLGLIIYQMITGVKTFGNDTPLFAVLRRLKELPPPPSQIVPGLGASWDFLISRCLNPDPAQRFSSASQLLNALDGSSAAQPPVTPRQSHIPRAWSPSTLRSKLAASAVAVSLFLAGAVLLYLHARRQPPPPASITVVLADFVNTTGEPVFDDTLKVALAAKLQQTPFLNLMPDGKIRAALRYMGLSARERLSQAVAREVCQREGGQVVLQGAIDNSSRGYIVTLRAMQCQTGETIAAKQFPADFRDSVLDALDQASEAMRRSLGESLESIHRFDVPLSDATTSSLEALTAYSQGNLIWNAQGESAALPYYQRATDLDPNFAMAYARLGTIYGNMGETGRSDDAMRKAYDRRDRVTEWERFYIASHYYGFVTGEVDKEMHAYEDWSAVYPHDMAWPINLSVDYGFTGQFDKAIQLQRRVILETPGLSPSYGDLAQFYLAVDHPDEAGAVLNEALQIHVQDANILLAEYSLAFYRADAAGMSKLLADTAGQAGIEDMLLAQQAATQDHQGQLSSGLQFATRAAAVAAKSGNDEIAANWLSSEALRQSEFGADSEARKLVALASSQPKAVQGRDVQLLIAFTSAQTGGLARAQSLLGVLARDHPLDTLIQSYWLPILRARIALSRHAPAQAIHLLQGTDTYDLGIFTPGQCMDAAFLRGQALLVEHQPAAAAIQYRNILAHRGLVLNCATGALSQLGLARALALSGDTAGSRIAYQDLFALWAHADKNLRPLLQAQAEYRALR